jgi:hypothetical protein
VHLLYPTTSEAIDGNIMTLVKTKAYDAVWKLAIPLIPCHQ